MNKIKFVFTDDKDVIIEGKSYDTVIVMQDKQAGVVTITYGDNFGCPFDKLKYWVKVSYVEG